MFFLLNFKNSKEKINRKADFVTLLSILWIEKF